MTISRCTALLAMLCLSSVLCRAQVLYDFTDSVLLKPWYVYTPLGSFGQNDDENDGKNSQWQEKPYQTGLATYYSARTHGRMMASGKRYDKNALFCAHRKLPFGTKVRVVNKKNGREVVVEVLDRGPFGKGRIIDLSNKAAAMLDMLRAGVVPVELYLMKP